MIPIGNYAKPEKSQSGSKRNVIVQNDYSYFDDSISSFMCYIVYLAAGVCYTIINHIKIADVEKANDSKRDKKVQKKGCLFL